jgi:two-component system phosphate regulon response regulator PhoB
MPAKILIVDDEPDLLGMVDVHLRRAGFETIKARTGGEALRWAGESRPDLILLDIMLPDLPGTEVCRLLRHDPATRHIPVIFLSARSDEADRIRGFELGADDYIIKTAGMREMVLRVQAVLRRAGEKPAPEAEHQSFGDLELDIPGHRAWVNEAEVNLTALEFRLLRTLLERRGRVQSRETLLEDVWGISADVTTRTVDTHVKRLREKLGVAGRYVETVRGVGYRFAESPT